MKAVIVVTLKPSVFDPQGEAVKHAIHGLGMDSVKDVRIGKRIEVEIGESSQAVARKKLGPICRDLLSNPVIEDYCIEFGKTTPVRPASKARRPASAPKKAASMTKAGTEVSTDSSALTPEEEKAARKKAKKEKKKALKKKKKDKKAKK